MLPSYFDCSFVQLRQKVRLRTELSPNFLSTFGPNPTRKARFDLQLWVEGPAAAFFLNIVYVTTWDNAERVKQFNGQTFVI